jgi:surface antigen
MLTKKKGLSAFVAALLATATAVQPVMAQNYGYGGYADQYDQYGNPYNGPYGTQSGQYGSSYDSQYDSQYGGQYESQYGGQYDTQYGSQYGGQYDNGYSNDGYYDDEYQRNEAARTWRDGYSQGYQSRAYDQPAYDQRGGYRDERYAYRVECEQERANRQVGGLLIGALAGGLLGNAVSNRRSRGTGTAVGAIIGGAVGVGIGGNLDCNDRNYVQQTYYDGFERGNPHTTYRWRNPQSGNYGAMRVGDYYQDRRRNERCATYSQTIWVNGHPEDATGYACRRGDGTWEIIS